ncbi:MAG: [FeFe] hydrogenase H-cluster maturation GTPase HydF [Lentisphaeria bacterium]|nr:[FeFe] hydrogenase H-cluster maturation GTPase HydF [Lentisphaeria bacterium]
MQTTPKSLRLQILFAGRINAGKSSVVNLLSGQNTAIISAERGTTTDVVEKAMELRPLGPVLLLDSAGTDDNTPLGELRIGRTHQAMQKADVLVIVTAPGIWEQPEQELFDKAKDLKLPVLIAVNKCDTAIPEDDFLAKLTELSGAEPILTAAVDPANRDRFIEQLVAALLKVLPEDYFQSLPLLNDLLPENGHALMMVPIDTQAPKGRLILPQVQAIRDALDGNAICTVAKENAFPEVYSRFTTPPDLVICDSQVVKTMIDTLPADVPCTTFSILMARLKGDLEQLIHGARAIADLKENDRILIAESCTHHAGTDDIGRVKIPMLLQKKCNCKLNFEFYSGADFPADLKQYKLVIHCGGCMLNRRAMLNRLSGLAQADVPVTNYGVCISCCTGVLDKVITPFGKRV